MQGDISKAQKVGIRCVSGFMSGFLGAINDFAAAPSD